MSGRSRPAALGSCAIAASGRGARARPAEGIFPERAVLRALARVQARSAVVSSGGRLICYRSGRQRAGTSLAYLNDPAQRAEIAGRGEDAEHMHLRYIRQINAAVRGKPAGMAITTHMCRGNFRSSWVASGGYDFVAEALFSELDVDGFFLEYDDERSGGFEPLRFVPEGKMVVLGLVTTKRPELESKDDLKRRIDEAG